MLGRSVVDRRYNSNTRKRRHVDTCARMSYYKRSISVPILAPCNAIPCVRIISLLVVVRLERVNDAEKEESDCAAKGD